MEALSRLWAHALGYSSVLQRELGEAEKPPPSAKPSVKRLLLVAVFFVVPATALLAYFLEWAMPHTAPAAPRRFPFGRVLQLEDVAAREARLPQHNLDLPFPEGRNGRFVCFSGQTQSSGKDFAALWSEVTVLSTLALLAKRAYVFRPLVLSDGEWPLGLFLSGPSAGGNWGAGVDAPRAISSVFWEQVCPPERRRILSLDAVEEQLDIASDTDGKTAVDLWARYLSVLSDNCIEVQGSRPLLSWLSTSRAISLWPIMATSPVITRRVWSMPVMLGVARNLPRIISNFPTTANSTFMRTYDDLLRPLLVLHVPRTVQCASFAGWAQLPSLPDHQADAVCAPSVQQIVTKTALALEQYAATLPAAQPPPDHVYISTDGDAEFIAQLKAELLQDGDGMGGKKWKVVTSSADLILMGAENEARQAVEIEIARRAALFVGSGFSSTSSAVVALRLAQGSLPSTIRFF